MMIYDFKTETERKYKMNKGVYALLGIKPGLIILIVVLVVMIAIIITLYVLGKKAQKKQAEQQEMMEANKQTISMLIIDKKRMKLKESGLPQNVIEQVPKIMRGQKLHKVKVGPQIMNLISDEKIFDAIPLKKEVKASVSGMYILSVRGLHGKVEAPAPKKKGFFKRAMEKAQEKAGAKPIK